MIKLYQELEEDMQAKVDKILEDIADPDSDHHAIFYNGPTMVMDQYHNVYSTWRRGIVTKGKKFNIDDVNALLHIFEGELHDLIADAKGSGKFDRSQIIWRRLPKVQEAGGYVDLNDDLVPRSMRISYRANVVAAPKIECKGTNKYHSTEGEMADIINA